MDINEYKDVLREKLSIDRYEHTIRVYETALTLVKHHGGSLEQVSQAALLHDIAKCEETKTLKNLIYHYELPTSLLQYNKELWHGPVGAKLVADLFHIENQDVLNSIYYHTTGRQGMSLVELIIFVADYIEPGRDFPGVDDVRNLADQDLYAAAQKALQNTLIFLISKNATIHPDTLAAYNELTMEVKKGRDV